MKGERGENVEIRDKLKKKKEERKKMIKNQPTNNTANNKKKVKLIIGSRKGFRF